MSKNDRKCFDSISCNLNDELDAKYELRVMILMYAVILSATYPSVLHVDKMIAYIEKPWLSWRILYYVEFKTLGAPAGWKVSGRHASSFFIFTFPLDPNVLHWYLSVGIQILNPDWLFLFDENIPKTIITLICQLDSILRITRVLHVKKNQLVPTIDENAGIDALFANSKEAGALSTATPFLDFLRTEGEHQNLASLLKPTQQ